MKIEIAPYELRPWRPDDAESLIRNANDREVWINMRDRFPHPYTAADADAWIALASSSEPLTNFAIVEGGEAIGGIGLELGSDVHRISAEVGYWLGRAHWGKGVMATVLPEFSRWAMEAFGLLRIFATAFAWNPASVRVLEKSGYTFEGRLRKSVLKDGKVTDQLMYALIADDPEG
jgi:[ribosomal protein S5]-alanine N-acetyltransferase